MTWAYPLAIGTLAATCAASGVLLIRSRSKASGGFLITTAAFAAYWAVSQLTPLPLADRAAAVVWAVTGPAALLSYPRVARNQPISLALTIAAIVTGFAAVAVVHDSDTVGALGLTIVGLLIIQVWWRLDAAARDRTFFTSLLWMALSVVVAGAALGIFAFSSSDENADDLWGIVDCALFTIVPVGMAVGVRKSTPVDIRALTVRCTVAVVAMIVFFSVLMLMSSVVEVIIGRPPKVAVIGIFAAICALGFHRATVVLNDAVDQLLFGRRPDPLKAAGAVALALRDDPSDALQSIRETLVFPYVALRVDDVITAESGDPIDHVKAYALPGTTSELLIGLRSADLRIPSADETVIRVVLPALSQMVRAQQLAADVVVARSQTVRAIEDERRRLRRELHDGLGPTLSGVAFSADAARNLVTTSPDAALELLTSLRADTASAISEIRRIVVGLRPPALDELGLVGAIQQRADQTITAEGQRLSVTVTADELPSLPAGVEVAAYRIAVEALTNAARHARCANATIDLSARDGNLTVNVTDDGPSRSSWRPGVGLSSMRERAEQIGGAVRAGPDTAGGRVRAVLPIPPTAGASPPSPG